MSLCGFACDMCVMCVLEEREREFVTCLFVGYMFVCVHVTCLCVCVTCLCEEYDIIFTQSVVLLD